MKINLGQININNSLTKDIDILDLSNLKSIAETNDFNIYCSYGEFFKLIDGKYHGVKHTYSEDGIEIKEFNGKVLTVEEFNARSIK